jgi:hypothetical protein
MMTPQTTVVPFEFYICDLSGTVLSTLSERFVICDDYEIPFRESLLENAEVLLESKKIKVLGEHVYKAAGFYVTHAVSYSGQRCLAAARRPRRGAVPPGAGSG